MREGSILALCVPPQAPIPNTLNSNKHKTMTLMLKTPTASLNPSTLNPQLSTTNPKQTYTRPIPISSLCKKLGFINQCLGTGGRRKL